MSALSKRIRDCAEDPMWDAHAEVPKVLLAHAANHIEALEAALREAIPCLEEQGYLPQADRARAALASEQDK